MKKKLKKTLKRLHGDYNRLLFEYLYSLPENKKYTLLDIGAGPSRLLEKYMPKNIAYKSLDHPTFPGEEKRHDYLVDLDKTQIPVRKNTYDIVVCLEVLEHTIYPKRIIKEINRICKKDGKIFLSMPNEYNFYSRIQMLFGFVPITRKAFDVTEKNYHIHVATSNDLIEFYKTYTQVEKIHFSWQSRNIRKYFPFVDKFINTFAKVLPSLFASSVAVMSSKREIFEKNLTQEEAELAKIKTMKRDMLKSKKFILKILLSFLILFGFIVLLILRLLK